MKARLKRQAERYAKRMIDRAVDEAIEKERNRKPTITPPKYCVNEPVTKQIGAVFTVEPWVKDYVPLPDNSYVHSNIARSICKMLEEQAESGLFEYYTTAMSDGTMVHRGKLTVVVPSKGE